MIIEVSNELDMKMFGQRIGLLLRGGEIIELLGDVGAGKTTLVKGIAIGLGVEADIQSPSFSINRTYQARDGLVLSHYDFYRLKEPGLMADEILESIDDQKHITVVEWADVVEDVLPKDRLTIRIVPLSENDRQIKTFSLGARSRRIEESLAK